MFLITFYQISSIIYSLHEAFDVFYKYILTVQPMYKDQFRLSLTRLRTFQVAGVRLIWCLS